MRLPIAALFLFAAPLAAQERLAGKTLYAPGPTPDRIVLTWRKDPARSQSVTWRTDMSVPNAIAECVDATGGPDFDDDKKRSVVAVSSIHKSDLGEALFHSAHFENLTPNTKYAYRVGDGVAWSEWHHFKTAAEKPEKFSFLYFGDAQVQLREHWSRVVREAYRAAPEARFSIHAGDLVNIGGSDAEWGEWFQVADVLNRTMSVVPTPGNHEYMHLEGRGVPSYWLKQFALPQNGPKEPAGVFHFDFQGARIVCLNSNEKIAEQVAWLKSVLEKNPNRWTILTFHHPVYSSAAGRDSPELRELWQPIFEKYKVDLVLQGHDHCYGRSGLHKGPVYVVSVSGPRFYELQDDAWMVRKGERIQLFQVITIDGDTLSFEARTAAGELYDSFTLRKTEGSNVLTDGPHDPRSVPVPKPRDLSGWWGVLVIVSLMGMLAALRWRRMRNTKHASARAQAG